MATLPANMQGRRALLLAGSLWEIVRFFLVISLVALLLQEAGAAGAWLFPWLLMAGSGNLLVAVGGIMMASFPERYGSFLALLRLGKVLALFSFVLLAVSGALRLAVGHEILSVGPLILTEGPVLVAVCLLDILFLAFLFSWHDTQAAEPAPQAAEPAPQARAEPALPEYEETEVKGPTT